MPDPGSRTRFDAVVREVLEPIRRYLARRVDAATAEDVLSETLVALWRRLPDVPHGEEIPYAIGVARLQLRNALRSRRRQERLVARIVTIDPPTETRPVDDGDPRVEVVHEALGHLREADAEVLRLHAWDGLPVTDIARVLGITPNAVSIRLHRARRRLADGIRKIQGDGGHVEERGGTGR